MSMQIEIIHVLPRQTRREKVEVPEGATIAVALASARLGQELSARANGALDVGIFGERCELSEKLSDGDRIEIYRPLLIDPMRQRRERAKK
jgi:uncharacterized protein